MSYETGEKVKWRWGQGWGEGKISERFTDDVQQTISGTTVKRTASADKPAFLIEQDDGACVLKSIDEIEPA